LLGTTEFEVIQFVFHFYGFETYNILVNPNNRLVKTVLMRMVESGDYFFFAISPNQSVTFQVWFRPQASGSASGNVSILSSNLASPASISVSGAGVTSATSPTPAQHSVTLTWDASASSAIGYRVYRDDGNGLSPISQVLPNLTYTDSTVVSGNSYIYAVTSVDSAGDESVYSNQVSAVIPTP